MRSATEGRRRLRRVLTVVAIIGAVGLFAGCLDIVQYVSGDSDSIDVYFRLTLQKGIFEMAAQMGGEPQDLDSMFEQEFNLDEEDVLSELPPGVTADYQQVDTDSEFGFEMRYSVSRTALDMLDDNEAPFVPRVSPWGLTIPLGEGGGEEGADPASDAFLGSTKYRLMISKRLVSRVSEARIVSGPDSNPITVTDLPDVWLLEFPISLWYGSADSPRIEVLF